MKCALKISCLSCPPTLCGKCGLLDPGHDHHRRHHQSSANEDSPIFRHLQHLQFSFWILQDWGPFTPGWQLQPRGVHVCTSSCGWRTRVERQWSLPLGICRTCLILRHIGSWFKVVSAIAILQSFAKGGPKSTIWDQKRQKLQACQCPKVV